MSYIRNLIEQIVFIHISMPRIIPPVIHLSENLPLLLASSCNNTFDMFPKQAL